MSLPRPRVRDVVVTDIAYRRVLDALARGEHGLALRRGDEALRALSQDPQRRRWIPAVQLALGSLHAEAERFVLGAALLDEGLRGLEGTHTAHLVPDTDWYVLRLVGLELVLGRYASAFGRLPALLEPTATVETRLAATRAQAQLAATLGQFGTAHQHLNTAAGLARRACNHLLGALVDGDRAMLLAVQDRGHEAMANADRVLPSLARPGNSPFTRWANQHAVACASLLARRASFAGDERNASRYAAVAADVAPRTHSTYSTALAGLAIAGVAAVHRRRDDADHALLDAVATLQRLGAVPAEADAVADRGRLALATGLTASARPLLEYARNRYEGIGHRAGAAEMDRLLALLPPEGS